MDIAAEMRGRKKAAFTAPVYVLTHHVVNHLGTIHTSVKHLWHEGHHVTYLLKCFEGTRWHGKPLLLALMRSSIGASILCWTCCCVFLFFSAGFVVYHSCNCSEMSSDPESELSPSSGALISQFGWFDGIVVAGKTERWGCLLGTLCPPFLAHFRASFFAFGSIFHTFSSSKYSFSTRNMAVASTDQLQPARPNRCHNVDIKHVALHWTTMQISGMSIP